jgi:hypothetical protein
MLKHGIGLVKKTILFDTPASTSLMYSFIYSPLVLLLCVWQIFSALFIEGGGGKFLL